MDMNKIRAFGSMHRYFQGPGALSLVGELAHGLGLRPLLVADQIVHDLVFPVASAACKAHGLDLAWGRVCGDVTRPAVQRLISQASKAAKLPDLVLAAGGGKGVDTGKAVALELGARLIVIPTSASNDGPCSRSFVYYDDHHRMVSVEKMPRNPDAVVVDTTLLVRSPRDLLISGIGDALCKLYEGNQARAAAGLNLFGGRNTLAAEQISIACDRIIRADAEAGLLAVKAGVADEAFERLTEALVLLSGLAFENSGLSIAHSLTRGLPLAAGTETTFHGFHVGYGLLVQFILEERSPEFMREQLDFYRRVGLAVNLHGLGVAEVNMDTFNRIAEGTMQSPHLHHFERSLSTADFVAAMARLETITT